MYMHANMRSPRTPECETTDPFTTKSTINVSRLEKVTMVALIIPAPY